MLAVAEQVEPELDRDKEAWRAVIEPELDNLRAALAWGLSADDPDRGRRLAAASAWLWNLHGRGGEGVGVLRRAIERAPNDRSLLQARLLTGFALIGDTAAPADLDPVREGDSIAAELGDDRLRGRCLLLTAVGTFYNDFGAAWELCERAVVCATAAGDEFGADGARALEGLILHFRDRHDASAEILRPTVDRLIRRGDRGIASTVLVFQSNSALYTGDLTLAQQLADHAAQVAEPLRDYHRVGTTRTQVALLRGMRGDIDGGLQELEQFLHLVEGAGPEVFVPGMARTLGLLHLWRGDFDHAVRWLAPEAVPSSELADTHLDALGMPPLAESLRRLGRVSEAAAVLERARAMAERLDMPRVLADTVDQQAHLATVAGEPDHATDLHHAALAIRTEHGLRTCYIDSLEALGALMGAAGREADAVALLAAASVARDRIGYRRRPIDDPAHDAVMATLEAGLGADTFARTWHAGCELALDDAVALARRTRGQRGRPTAGWASLTPTELEVVRLVADGLNNPQVAAKLFMSRATVKTHLSHVFTKLGVANRTELARLATTRLTQ
jgi:DNA-binding CsgD family transcriptional regulator